MKKIIVTFVLTIVLTSASFSQWLLQYSNQLGYFRDIDFTSLDTGWVCGPWIMMRTTNAGNTWDTLRLPIINTSFLGVSFIDNNTGWYLEENDNQGNNRIYKTSDAGNNWSLQYTFPQSSYVWNFKFINNNFGIAIGRSKVAPDLPQFWKTNDGGDSWNMMIIDNAYSPSLFKLFFVDSSNGWAAGDGIYRTTNGGSSWNLLAGPYSMSVCDIQFTTPDIGWYSDIFNIKKTTDGGSTWVQQAAGGNGWEGSCLFFIDSDTGYYSSYSGIMKTTTGGSSWVVQLSNNSFQLTDMLFLNSQNGWIAANTGKIFHTTNGGLPVELTDFKCFVRNKNEVELNWQTASETNNKGFEVERNIGSGISDPNWEMIGFITGNGTTTEIKKYSYIDYNVTYGKYFYRLKQIDFDGRYEYSNEIEVVVPAEESFELSENYPNPFNNTTVITYSIPYSSKVIIKIFDLLGNEVESLVNEEKSAGSYNVIFNGSQLTSGVYYYQLLADGFIDTKKFVLLK